MSVLKAVPYKLARLGPGNSAMVQIESSSVIRLILQFLKTAGLNKSVETLSNEANVHLTEVKNKHRVVSCIKEKRWLDVLAEVTSTDLPANILSDLYQLIFLSSINVGDYAAATAILRESRIFQEMKHTDQESYQDFEAALNSRTLDSNSNSTMNLLESSSITYFESIDEPTASTSLLLSIIGDALKWRTQGATLPPNTKFDCLKGFINVNSAKGVLEIPNIVYSRVSMPGITSIMRKPLTNLLMVCTEDGMITLLDCLTGKPHSDYINADTMAVPSYVTCCRFSADGALFVAGCADGGVAVWRISSGNAKATRFFNSFSSQTIKSVDIVSDGNILVCANKTLFVLGMRSGAVLRQVSGVNMAFVLQDGAIVGIGRDVIVFDSDFKESHFELEHAPTLLSVDQNGSIIIDGGVFDFARKKFSRLISSDVTFAISSSNHMFFVTPLEIQIFIQADMTKVGEIVLPDIKTIAVNQNLGLLIAADSKEILFLNS